MPNMLDQVKPGTELVTGSPQYQQQIVEQRKKTLAPAYAQAVQRARQGQANRGLMNSGLGGEQEQALGQEYRGALGQAASEAATQGADVTEQNRRQAIQDALRLRMQGNEFGQQDKVAKQRQEEQQQQVWNELIGGAAGGVGKIAGSALFGLL